MSSATLAVPERRPTSATYTRRALAHGVLIVGSLIFLFPFIWLLLLSFQTLQQFYLWPPKLIPDPWQFTNYPDALRLFDFGRYFWNTTYITVLSLIGQATVSAMVAYSFARLRWPLKNFWFIVMLATMMVPPQVTLIPLYIIWRDLKGLDTYWPLILPAYLGTAYYIFLARQFFMTIPLELEEAGRIDGASTLDIIFRIMVPLSIPLMLTLSLFSVLSHWNDFFAPLLYLNTKSKFTLQLGLLVFRGQYDTDYPKMFAATATIVMPIVAFFFVGQRYFIKSVVLSGLKG
ncbi:MAG TPA: carbohydrate ABC transporter permease [Chloroflexota bacterium]|jgi:multiple sugar transport system permease protein|nr:carbohydrate ABC transporter permease [Chloroflexota bacterium]